MADMSFQGETGAVKSVMKRLQRGSHKRSARASTSAPNGGRSSSVSKIRAAIEKGKKGMPAAHSFDTVHVLLWSLHR